MRVDAGDPASRPQAAAMADADAAMADADAARSPEAAAQWEAEG